MIVVLQLSIPGVNGDVYLIWLPMSVLWLVAGMAYLAPFVFNDSGRASIPLLLPPDGRIFVVGGARETTHVSCPVPIQFEPYAFLVGWQSPLTRACAILQWIIFVLLLPLCVIVCRTRIPLLITNELLFAFLFSAAMMILISGSLWPMHGEVRPGQLVLFRHGFLRSRVFNMTTVPLASARVLLDYRFYAVEIQNEGRPAVHFSVFLQADRKQILERIALGSLAGGDTSSATTAS